MLEQKQVPERKTRSLGGKDQGDLFWVPCEKGPATWQSPETRNSPDHFHTPRSDIKRCGGGGRVEEAISWEILECCTMDQAVPSFSVD